MAMALRLHEVKNIFYTVLLFSVSFLFPLPYSNIPKGAERKETEQSG